MVGGIFSMLGGGFKLVSKMLGFLWMKKAIERDILAKDLKNIKEKTNVKKDIARNSAADRRKRLRSHVKHK